MRNIGLHTVLRFLTGSSVSNSSAVELDNFISSCTRLAKSMIIYSEEELNFSQDIVGTKPDDLSEWRYIKHLQGLPHSSDKGIDNLQSDMVNMNVDDLYDKYPGYEVLIDGMKHPVTLDVNGAGFKAPKHMEILYYNKYLVDDTELYLISDLQRLIYSYEHRWNVSSYGIVDQGYLISYKFILAQNIVLMIINIRDNYRNTNFASDFHIKEYLQGYGRLGRFFDFYSDKQKLWFYRNIRQVIHNSGQDSVHDALIKVLFVDEGYEISNISFNRFNRIRRDNVMYRHEVLPLGKNPEVSLLPSNRLKSLTDEITPYNKDVHFDETDELGLYTLQNVQETKYLKLDVGAPASITISTIEYKLNYWLYAASSGLYTEEVEFKYLVPDGEEKIKIDPLTGYILFMLLVCDVSGEGESLPDNITRTARNIQKEAVVLDRDFIHIGEAELKLIESSIISKPDLLTRDSFKRWTDEIIDRTDGVFLRGTGFTRVVKSLEYSDYIKETVADHIVDLDVGSVKALNLYAGIDGIKNKARLLSDLISTFTGVESTNAGEALVKAAYFIDVYNQLSSYDTEILLNGSATPPMYSKGLSYKALFKLNKIRTQHNPCNFIPSTIMTSTVRNGRHTYARVSLSSSSARVLNETKSFVKIGMRSNITEKVLPECASSSRFKFSHNLTTANINTPPVITILGNNPDEILQDLTENPEPYQDPGATAVDAEDGNVSVEYGGVINVDKLGQQTLTYTAVDTDGATTIATRVVNVVPVPNEPPTITLLGSNPEHLVQKKDEE